MAETGRPVIFAAGATKSDPPAAMAQEGPRKVEADRQPVGILRGTPESGDRSPPCNMKKRRSLRLGNESGPLRRIGQVAQDVFGAFDPLGRFTARWNEDTMAALDKIGHGMMTDKASPACNDNAFSHYLLPGSQSSILLSNNQIRPRGVLRRYIRHGRRPFDADAGIVPADPPFGAGRIGV